MVRAVPALLGLLLAGCIPAEPPVSVNNPTVPMRAARNGVFDADYAAARQQIDKGASAGCNQGNRTARWVCEDRNVVAGLRDNPRLRGTPAYCEQTYAPLGTATLKAKAEELARLRHQARSETEIEVKDQDHGEVSRQQLEGEYRCVHDLLLARGVKIGVDLGGGFHVPEGEVCTAITCGPGGADAARAASGRADPLQDTSDALLRLGNLFE